SVPPNHRTEARRAVARRDYDTKLSRGHAPEVSCAPLACRRLDSGWNGMWGWEWCTHTYHQPGAADCFALPEQHRSRRGGLYADRHRHRLHLWFGRALE